VGHGGGVRRRAGGGGLPALLAVPLPARSALLSSGRMARGRGHEQVGGRPLHAIGDSTSPPALSPPPPVAPAPALPSSSGRGARLRAEAPLCSPAPASSSSMASPGQMAATATGAGAGEWQRLVEECAAVQAMHEELRQLGEEAARRHGGSRAARAPGGGAKELVRRMLEVNAHACTRPRFEHPLLLLPAGDADRGEQGAELPLFHRRGSLAQGRSSRPLRRRTLRS
jgi:hypothetical protein